MQFKVWAPNLWPYTLLPCLCGVNGVGPCSEMSTVSKGR